MSKNTHLSLTRRRGEAITLTLPSGDTIRIVLKEADRGQGRLGICAPQDVKIMRDELRTMRDVLCAAEGGDDECA